MGDTHNRLDHLIDRYGYAFATICLYAISLFVVIAGLKSWSSGGNPWIAATVAVVGVWLTIHIMLRDIAARRARAEREKE